MSVRSRFCTAVAVLAYCTATSQTFATSDSLVVKPAHPTTADSIRLTIVIPNWDCCTRYTYDSTLAPLVGDSEILLSYQHYLPQICPMIACLDVPRLLAFKRAPLAAGTYVVYESAQLQCTTQVCPQYILAPVKIGKFVVQPSTRVVSGLPGQGRVAANARDATMAVFNVRGELVRQETRMPRGVYIARALDGRVTVGNGLMK
jgi:hypothetical protein